MNPLLCRGFTRRAGTVWCLREGEGDGGVDEFEGSALGGSGGSEDVDVTVGEDGGVAGEGGEVVKQAAEAADGVVVVVGFGAGFGGGGLGGRCGVLVHQGWCTIAPCGLVAATRDDGRSQGSRDVGMKE